jgi:hypothetical protein
MGFIVPVFKRWVSCLRIGAKFKGLIVLIYTVKLLISKLDKPITCFLDLTALA